MAKRQVTPRSHRERNPNTSTHYSAARYAHPFFLPATPDAREPINGHTRMTSWSKQQLGPVPAAKQAGRMNLADLIGTQGTKEITDIGEIRFHALGDSGYGHANEAENIAEE